MQTTEEKTLALKAFITLFDVHTKYFHNVLDSLTDKDASNRLGTKANHIGWIAGSLLYERYELARLIGAKIKYTPSELFVGHKGIQDEAQYPSLEQYKKDWDQVTPVLKSTLMNLNEDQLNGPDPYEMPGGNYNLFDTVTFCTDRESYCIGQIALYRRLLGYPAMKYD